MKIFFITCMFLFFYVFCDEKKNEKNEIVEKIKNRENSKSGDFVLFSIPKINRIKSPRSGDFFMELVGTQIWSKEKKQYHSHYFSVALLIN